jgi:hypothetical protein
MTGPFKLDENFGRRVHRVFLDRGLARKPLGPRLTPKV